METFVVIQSIASIGTAIGVTVAAWQLRQNERLAQTRFEDDVNNQYREIIRRLPIKAVLGEELNDEEYSAALPALFQYIDLSNEQVFLRAKDRVRKATWEEWRDGIKSHLKRPAFRRAWEEIQKAPSGSFEELRRLEDEGFATDPSIWRRRGKRPTRPASKIGSNRAQAIVSGPKATKAAETVPLHNAHGKHE